MKVAHNDGGAPDADAAGGRTGQGRGTGTLPATGGQTTGTGGNVSGGTGGQGTGGIVTVQGTGGSVGQGGAGGSVLVGSGGAGGRATVVGSGGQAGGGKGGAATGGSTGSVKGGSTGAATGGSAGATTSGTGGRSTGGAAGATSGTGGRGGAGGTTGCAVSSQVKSSRTARSAGFSGTYQANYYPLYSTACTKVADCASACVAAGGTAASCAASECIDSTPDYCLPPTYWFDLDHLRIEGNTIEDSAWITMVNNPYRDQLIATDFQFEIPATATIQGIVMSINRSADSTSMIADYEVKLVREGATVGLDRGGTAPWPMTFEYANYGDPNDRWGATWTPADVNAAGFGVAMTPTYLSSGGNARGYVDFIRATVYYCP